MGNLDLLSRYFGSGTAESEMAFLDEAFVPHQDFVDIISIPPASPRIVVGKKGSGKSAFIRFFQSKMQAAKVPVLLIRPDDLEISKIEDNSLAGLKRQAKIALLKAIGVKIGSQIDGFVLNDDDLNLFRLAQNEGIIGEEWIQKIIKFINPIGKAVSDVDFSAVMGSSPMINPGAVKKAVLSNLGRAGHLFYLLIDDTDQVAELNQAGQLNRIWAFLLAARSIMEDCDNIRCIITLRQEVWFRLSRSQSGQRDQVDHFRSLVYHINPDENSVRDIVAKRLSLVCHKSELHWTAHPYEPFFAGDDLTLPSTTDTVRAWDSFITKSSRERPRDAIQLVDLLIKAAKKDESEKIQARHARQVLPQYSANCVHDLQLESDLECPEIESIIRRFSIAEYNLGSFMLDAEQAKLFISKLPSHFSITLLGSTLKPNDVSDTFALWKFLREIGFISARVADLRMSEGYRHIPVSEDVDLVSPQRWNDMQKIAWEIHPAYRSYLIQLRTNDENNYGLAIKQKYDRRKRK